MGTQGAGRKRNSKKEKSTAEDDALNLIAREAEARLAAKRAARAEAREIRMRELERQQKEIFQVQKKYYGLNTKYDDKSDRKWGDIEQWMEDSERYSRPPRPSQAQTLSDEDDRMSVGSRGSIRFVSCSRARPCFLISPRKRRNTSTKRKTYVKALSAVARIINEESENHLHTFALQRNCHDDDYSVLSSRSSLYEESLCSGSRRLSDSNSGFYPLEYSSYRSANSRTSSRANSARTSPVVDDRDYFERGSRSASALTASTLTSLGGSSSRRGSVETAITLDAETASREIKEIHELKDQIQDVESKYTQNLKEVKDALTEVEEKYRKAMVSNAQLDNEKNNLMYQVDTLKDSLTELEELLSESRREYEEKVKEFERERHAHGVLQFQFNEMKETLKQSEELLNEIRQLRMKQEGFAREIADLQETVEWKDKKIGALERQKEYTDAIRNERDELREEVVKLKDILKKHGIVLGPDLSINGDAAVTEVERIGNDGDPQSPQCSPTSPSEGNNMLGSSEVTPLRSSGKEEMDQERDPDQSTNRLSCTDDASGPIQGNDSGLSPGLQTELTITKAIDETVLCALSQGTAATNPVEMVTQDKSDLEERDTRINDGDLKEYCTEIKKQPEYDLKNNMRDQETNKSGSYLEEEIQDSELVPLQNVGNDSQPCCHSDVIEFESCPEEVKISEQRPNGVLQDPNPGLQEMIGFELHNQEEKIIDAKSHPHVAVNDFEPCFKDAKDPESSPQVDVTDSEPPQDSIQDIKPSQSCPQVVEKNIHDSELCQRVQAVKDCEPQREDPESNAELRHKIAEGSCNEAEKIVTKPLSKSANAAGKKKKKKKRGKRKEGSIEKTPQNDKKAENVEEKIKKASKGTASGIKKESATKRETDSPTIALLVDSNVAQVGIVEDSESSNVAKDTKMDHMFSMLEQKEAGNVQILEQGTSVDTYALNLPLIQTKTDQDADEGKIALEFVEVHEGFIPCSEPMISHSGTDIILDSESREKDSILDDATTKEVQGQDHILSLEDTAELDVEKCHLEPSEKQNEMSVAPTKVIDDSQQAFSSDLSTAVNFDTPVGLSDKDHEEKPLINQEYKELEEKCASNEELLALVKPENSCDFNTEQLLKESRDEPVDERSLLCEKQVLGDDVDSDVLARESDEAKCMVSNGEMITAEAAKELENSHNHQEVPDVDTNISEADMESLDLDDLNMDTTVEKQTNEDPEKREVQVDADDEHNIDITSAPENLNDEEVRIHVATPDTEYKQEVTLVDTECAPENVGTVNHGLVNPPKDQEVTSEDLNQQGNEEDIDEEDEKGQSFDFDDMDIDAAVEMQTVENPGVGNVEVGGEEVHSNQHVATPDKCEQNILGESSPEYLETANDTEEQNYISKDREACNTSLSETEDQPSSGATSLEVSDAVEEPKDLRSTQSNGDTPPSGRDRKKNGKKGKSKGKDDCKMTYYALLLCLFTLKTFFLSPSNPEIRLRKLVDEREKMIEQIKKLKAQVDHKSPKNGTDGTLSAEGELLENGSDPHIMELQRDSSRQVNDMKFKLVKAEQEVTALEQNVSRLEGQVGRYKTASENAEKVEDELKAEKRKLQRELRSALDKVDELESNNNHLNKRLEKMKSSRGMAQTP
ncbi:uncharacterized protein lrrfip1a [Stigmatopora nigra]